MKFLAAWSLRPQDLKTAQQRFVEKGGQYGEGVQLLGQWHSANGAQGWSVVESDSVMALNTWLDAWADILDITITPVLEAKEAAEYLAKKVKQS